MRLAHTMIRVKDLDATLAFYTDFLGLKKVRQKPIGDEAVIARVEQEGWWYRRSRPEMSSKYIFVKDPNGYDIEILEAKA